MTDTKKLIRPFEGVEFGGHSKKKGSKKRVVITFSILSIIAIIFISIVAFEAFNFASDVQSNWREIQFALQKPAIVRAVRVDYEKKEASVEASYAQQKQTAQDQLIQQVTTQLQDGGTSK